MDQIVNPNLSQLVDALMQLARAIGVEEPKEERLRSIVDYVLYDHELDGDRGRRSVLAFKRGLLTEREVRNLIIHHGWMSLTCWHEIRDAPPVCESSMHCLAD